jgi:hypothetical protein
MTYAMFCKVLFQVVYEGSGAVGKHVGAGEVAQITWHEIVVDALKTD